MEAEAFVRCPGAWKNFDELEENLSLPELQAILESAREVEHASQKFAAALKGINLDEGEESSKKKFEAIQDRVNAELSGKSQDEFQFEELGIEVEIIEE